MIILSLRHTIQDVSSERALDEIDRLGQSREAATHLSSLQGCAPTSSPPGAKKLYAVMLDDHTERAHGRQYLLDALNSDMFQNSSSS